MRKHRALILNRMHRLATGENVTFDGVVFGLALAACLFGPAIAEIILAL